ncbi:hypothetical protein ACFWTE_02605 [Nocardiopsis sp. NPDC058631]|uniref:hypothetical protein n=1 Tax=Nocardiopsis sp. NPDC058631 TaxID=3346566 RepID=UPI00364AB45A
MSGSSPQPGTGPWEADRAPRPQDAEDERPLAAVAGLVLLGVEDAPTCSDGTCW